MLTTLIIPVIDTENGKYEYKGEKLSREVYESMVMDNFLATDRQVSRFVDNMAHGISNVRPSYGEYNSRTERDYPDIVYKFYEAEAFVQDTKKNDIEQDFFDKHASAGDMFILLLNINPNSLEGDAESEIRFWLDDSLRIHRDYTLDDETKLKALPKRGLKIKVGEKTGILEECKILQDYSDKKYPFKFAIIVKKIIF